MQRFHDMLVKVRGNLQTLIDQGKSEDEAVRGETDGGVRRGWGQGFMNPEHFTRFAYQSLKR